MKTLFVSAAILMAAASCAYAATMHTRLTNSAVALNPQPIPPGHQYVAGPVRVAPGVAVMLNPQPLPPKSRLGQRSR